MEDSDYDSALAKEREHRKHKVINITAAGLGGAYAHYLMLGGLPTLVLAVLAYLGSKMLVKKINKANFKFSLWWLPAGYLVFYLLLVIISG